MPAKMLFHTLFLHAQFLHVVLARAREGYSHGHCAPVAAGLRVGQLRFVSRAIYDSQTATFDDGMYRPFLAVPTSLWRGGVVLESMYVAGLRRLAGLFDRLHRVRNEHSAASGETLFGCRAASSGDHTAVSSLTCLCHPSAASMNA
jgi:hypothetical protein